VPTTIKLGDSGDDVKRLQRVFARTKVLGPDSVTGVFGPETEQAVKDFQQSNGLVLDGVVGPITWSHIHPYREASPTLQAGSLGPVVAMMQGVLKTGFGYAAPSTASSARSPKPWWVSIRPTPVCRRQGSWRSGRGWRPPAPPARRSRACRAWSSDRPGSLWRSRDVTGTSVSRRTPRQRSSFAFTRDGGRQLASPKFSKASTTCQVCAPTTPSTLIL
jgi:hypothetical protein